MTIIIINLTLEILWVLFVDEVGQVTTVVEDHVKRFSTREGSEGLLNAPGVFLFSLALPREDGDTSRGDAACHNKTDMRHERESSRERCRLRGGGVILGGENVLWDIGYG